MLRWGEEGIIVQSIHQLTGCIGRGRNRDLFLKSQDACLRWTSKGPCHLKGKSSLCRLDTANGTANGIEEESLCLADCGGRKICVLDSFRKFRKLLSNCHSTCLCFMIFIQLGAEIWHDVDYLYSALLFTYPITSSPKADGLLLRLS